jgi:AcrR family transcriptional regulator
MNDVADRAGLTKGGLYGHFRSKGQMLVEVIRWKYREFESSPAFVEALTDPKTAVGLLWSDNGLDVRLLVTDAAAAARHDADVLAGMAALDAERRAAVASRLEGLPADAEAVAWLILALASGIGLREAIGVRRPDATRLEPALARLIDALLG